MDSTNKTSPYEAEDLRAFLLGRLGADDTSMIEERLIVDEELFREIQTVEDELIDEHALGISSSDENKYVIERCEREVKWAQRVSLRKALFSALNKSARPMAKASTGRASERSRFGGRFTLLPRLVTAGLGVAAGVLIVICVLLLREKHGLEANLAHLERPQIHAYQMAQVQGAAAPAAPSIATLFFPEHTSRGAEPQAAFRLEALPSRLVELQLETPPASNATQLWNLTISDSSGIATLQNGLSVRQIGSVSFVRTYLDTSALSPGNYQVLLSSARSSAPDNSRRWALIVTR